METGGKEDATYDNAHNEGQEHKNTSSTDDVKIDLENRDPNDLNPHLRVS